MIGMRKITKTYTVDGKVFNRPKCRTKGCKNYAQNIGHTNSLGHPTFRHYCIHCHNKRREIFKEKKELVDRRSVPCCAVPGCKKKVIIRGTDNKSNIKFTKYCKEHVCISTTYSIFRKDFCENIDKRLGFKCTTKILIMAQLQVDHIDGNPFNNEPSNLQTLCACCHVYKTHANRDYATPGRKTLKKA